MVIQSDLLRRGRTNVNYERKELRDRKRDYELIDDCITGERAVKFRKTRYLPKPNPEDISEANNARYEAYLTRAVFYNVTQRTLSGLVGEVFRRDPVSEVPTGLDPVLADADGAGLTMVQLAKKAMRCALSKGRAGILVDFPQTGGDVTVADIGNGRVAPTITIYDALSVINWRTAKRGSQVVYTLVVLREEYDSDDDGFEVKRKVQYRVLRLTGDVYTVQIYRDDKPTTPQIVVTDAAGSPFDIIPFSFIGSENNDSEVDDPPMYDIASINVAHYRNSADYEESSYVVGQPTPVFSGLSEEWVNNVLGGRIQLGSRGGVALPENGTAMLLQAEPNQMPFTAMEHKERQMVALGARLVEQKQVQRTATEASNEASADTSILASTARNVSAAITFALKIACRFVGAAETAVKYELSTEYAITKLPAERVSQVIAAWQQEAITFSEMRAVLRQDGLATLDDEAAAAEIAEYVALHGDDETDDDADDTNDDDTQE